jgi:hypothetical protein
MHKRLFSSLIGMFIIIMTNACTLSLVGASASNATVTPAILPGQPQVQILPRLANATYQEGVLVYILATVRNAGADIALLEVFVDGVLLAQRANPNPTNATVFTVQETWLASGDGQHTISIAVTRGNGERGEDRVQILVTTDIRVALPANTEVTTPDTSVIITNQTPQAIPTSQPLIVPTTGGEVVIPTSTPNVIQAPENAPMLFVNDNINIRRGPSTAFNPAIGVAKAGDSFPIIGLNNDASWYKIIYQGAEAWVSAGLAAIRVEGDTTNLPREAGPATPTPSA